MTARILLVSAALALALAAPAGASTSKAERFAEVVAQIEAEPYQPAYVPEGYDSAFPDAEVLNTFPAEDYTSGSRQGSPDAPPWPNAFKLIDPLYSLDGAPLIGRYALHEGEHPGVVVVHGFNSNARDSVVRWAAMLYANGFNVAAIDMRDFPPEYRHVPSYGYPNWLQTLGWKEAGDVLAAGRFLAAQPGVTTVGVVGFSFGGETTVLALELDALAADRTFHAAMNFSGPSDQNAQIYSTADPPGCQTPFCTFPVTSALLALVVPPFTYTDPCAVLGDAGAYYGADPYFILGQADPYRSQSRVGVPLLNLYAQDDPLVLPFHATMMAGYNAGNPLQLTRLVAQGAHAYFYDRWWQQRAMLLYFKQMLPGAANDPSITTTATVNRTPGGAPFGSQLVDLGSPSQADADALARSAPYVCDTSRPSPSTLP